MPTRYRPARQWHPGHYYTIMGDKNNAAYMAKVYGELESTRALRGVQIRFNWAELEPSEGVYVYNSIDKHLHALSSRNKRLVILLQLKTFDPSIFPAPNYLKTDEYEGGVFAHTKGDETVQGYNLKLWNPNVRDRLVKLLEKLGKRYNSNPYFEGIGLTETAMGTPAIPLSKNQTDQFYSTLLFANKKMREEFFPRRRRSNSQTIHGRFWNPS